MPRHLITSPCDLEEEISRDGTVVCGMDEVGRGAWAGPLVIAAVIPGEGVIEGVRDSKRISAPRREQLARDIRNWSKGIGLGIVTNTEIDSISMAKAVTVAAQRALEEVEKISLAPEVVLLDGHYDFIRNDAYQVRTLVKGDDSSHAIAAASIVAKVFRDKYMASNEVHGRFRDFCFDRNKGYPSPAHKEALSRLGPTPFHRISWDILGSVSKYQAPKALF